MQVNLLRTDPEDKIQSSRQLYKHISGIEKIHHLGERYANFTNASTESVNKVLPKVGLTSQKKWTTPDILTKMEDRQKVKGNAIWYDSLHKEIRRECSDATENMLPEQCSLIERLDAAHRNTEVHRKKRGS